jgi:signal transduction histidine kinase
VDPTFRKRLVLSHVAVVVVIVLMTGTAVVALRSTQLQVEEARRIDHRLGLLYHLRGDARELATSARRYILGGDLKEQQRVLAIVHEMKAEREQLAARSTLAKGGLLEADLDEYIASLVHAMSFDDDDPIVRLSRFEDELARIRAPLSLTFDDIMARERTRREALRSAQTLARGAQWAVLLAGLLGTVLVLGGPFGALRRRASHDTSNLTSSRNELVAAAAELRAPLETIITESTQLRLASRDSTALRALDNIAKQASRVNGMLAELLDVSAMQTGGAPLRREPVDAAALVDCVIRDNRDAAIARGLRLRYEMQLAVTLFVDRERIRHVLDSVVQIAIAAARPGTELVLHVAAVAGGIRFAIIEPGPDVDAPATHDLALHLCSRVIEAHGGRIGIQTSAISRTYWFTLPTEPAILR